MYDARDNIPVQLMRRLHLLSSIVIYSQLRLRFKRLVRVVEEVVIWHGNLMNSRDAGGGGKSSAEQDEPQRDSMGVNGGAKWGWDKGGGEVRETIISCAIVLRTKCATQLRDQGCHRREPSSRSASKEEYDQ